ncbi:MAG: FAD-dependent monooxygenase [Devosiaceae bacterium]|nr:FAD-dependent monooxygenase [Devosiaceae bacterium]
MVYPTTRRLKLETYLEKIRIIDATNRLIRAPEALFDSSEVGEIAFGWNFANSKLSEQFAPLLKGQKNLDHIAESAIQMTRSGENWDLQLSDNTFISAPLIVGADGKSSFVRQSVDISIKQTMHKQSALVCDLTLSRPLEGESVEYHYPNGPFTLVPAGGNKANLVWVDNGDILEDVKKLPSAEIVKILQEKSQNLFGNLTLDTGVFVFPLSSHHAQNMGCNGVVLVGESGHAFPPIGAQGLNLSLRDVKDLVACIRQNPPESQKSAANWANKVANAYDNCRAGDIRRTSTMVDTLFKSLLSEILPAQALRTGGIWALKSIPPLRKHAFRLGMGSA